MSTAPKVLAVCVNWNGAEVLPPTLAALRADRYPNLEVLVVDNASSDGSAALAEESGAVLRLDDNRGYGAAINAAVRIGLAQTNGPDYFLVMNNDVLVVEDTVTRLVDSALRRGPGVYGPKVLRASAPAHLEAAWGRITHSHVLARFEAANALDGAHWSKTREVPLLLGSILLIDRRVFERCGLFDERFFMYHEEVDFLYRARLAGLASFFCPDARAYHVGGHSTRRDPSRKIYWIRRNTVLFLRKHRVSRARWGYFALTFAASLVFNALGFRWGRLRPLIRGVLDGTRMDLTAPAETTA
ncbi:MAG: glycosyltransferase family 2 protein [Acidobacteriota bacterium]